MSERLEVRCPDCNGTGQVTLKQKAERRDGHADFLRPEPHTYYSVTIHRDGSETVERRMTHNPNVPTGRE